MINKRKKNSTLIMIRLFFLLENNRMDSDILPFFYNYHLIPIKHIIDSIAIRGQAFPRF